MPFHGRCCSAEAEITASKANGDKREPVSGYRSPPMDNAAAWRWTEWQEGPGQRGPFIVGNAESAMRFKLVESKRAGSLLNRL